MYTLLIADDEKEIRNGLTNYFPWNEIGFDVVGNCGNGTEVLHYIEEKKVDVLLCDIKMPMMSGIEVAKSLFESKSSVKVVFLSGYKDFEYAKLALQYDVKDYIVKPTKYNEVFKVFEGIKRMLDEEQLFHFVRHDSSIKNTHDQVINKIKSYTEQDIENASLAEAAKVVHMNVHYLSRYFKEKTGVNYSDYLLEVKMNKAADMLMKPEVKAYEVSEKLGYAHPKNFTRSFKKVFGVTPREYRNNYIDIRTIEHEQT